MSNRILLLCNNMVAVRLLDVYIIICINIEQYLSGEQISVISLHGSSLWFDMNFSNFRLKASSAPYFPRVPLSTRRK